MASYWHMLAQKPAATGSKFTSSMLPPERQLTSRLNGRTRISGGLRTEAVFITDATPSRRRASRTSRSLLNQMISFHKLGTKQADDKVVYCRPDHPDWSFDVATTDDGKYLVLHIIRGSDPQNQVLVRDASAPVDAPFKELIGDFKNQFWFMGNEGTKFFYLTDLDAPTKRIVTMDIEHPGREHAAEVVAARKATLDDANILSGRLICHYLVDVLSQVEVFDLTGKPLGKVELPGKGTAVGFWRQSSRQRDVFLLRPATTGHAAFIATMFWPARSNWFANQA